jgi:hypothetical protein
MAEITISLKEDRAKALRDHAARLGLRPEELARASLEDLLALPDDTVSQVFDKVISKNRDLYRRLA